MGTILMVLACLSIVVAYVTRSRRKDRRADKEHQAVITAMSPGPRIRELTTARPNPMRTRKFASGSHPVFLAASAGDFEHVPTDYGTYTPAELGAAVLGRADTDTDSSYSDGFNGGGHHGH